jgi:cytochrome c551/c552
MILKALKWTIAALAVACVAIQFVRPAKTNPPVEPGRRVEAYQDVPAEVGAIFKRACNDCHSNQTNWPWYSNVAPVSWFVIDHVDHGRKHLNFSEWARSTPEQADDLLKAICQEVKQGSMPMDSYTMLHPDARLSDQDKKTICEWTARERQRIAHQSK